MGCTYVFLAFEGTAKLFSEVFVPFYIFTAMYEISRCSTSSKAFGIVNLLSICVLICISLRISDVEHFLICLLLIHVIFVKHLFKYFADNYMTLLVSSRNSMHILYVL